VKDNGRATTLAEVGVGGFAVLAAGPLVGARQARRMMELGLRPGTMVRVMMRTAGGGRVLGVDNLRIVVDRRTLAAIQVAPPPPAFPPEADPAPPPEVRSPASPARPAPTPSTRFWRGRGRRLTVLPDVPLGDRTERG
jgi:Fe2+ transport system protein FeoA